MSQDYGDLNWLKWTCDELEKQRIVIDKRCKKLIDFRPPRQCSPLPAETEKSFKKKTRMLLELNEAMDRLSREVTQLNLYLHEMIEKENDGLGISAHMGIDHDL